jgi:stage II sporulation protein D
VKSLKLTDCFLLFLFFLLNNCTNLRFIQPNPPGHSSVIVKKEVIEPSRQTSQGEIDFAEAFDVKDDTLNPTRNTFDLTDSLNPVSYRYPPFRVECKKVRVALKQNVKNAVFYTVGFIDLMCTYNGKKIPSVRGRISFDVVNSRVMVSGAFGTREITLPCTLSTKNEYNFIELGQSSYRGSMILISESPGTFTAVNMINVEEYLRGVVPLELGKRGENIIEALKAQAIAARTYTYKRMEVRKNSPFDLFSTISDQVYGGADVEYRESDMAIKLTEDLILVYEDSLINAYYHSTCGGKTANIEDVWDRLPCSYLRSIDDVDSHGKPWCAGSSMYEWNEKWSRKQLSEIINKSIKEIDPQQNPRGDIKDIRINSISSDGRIKSCTILGQGCKYDFSGDKIRFVLRRSVPQNAILQSACFKVESGSRKEFLINGRGYGHGVGMCQMGAINRAEAGQSFDTILKAYYTGVQIRTAVNITR